MSIIIALVVGEDSGDILGAGLMRSIKLMHPNAKFIGIPGPRMKKEGCDVLYEMTELSAIGITEVLKKLPRLLKISNYIIKYFKNLKPNVFIGIDFPDFNIRLAKRLKKIGIRTIHYVSPTIWAWRQYRIYQIARSIDLMLVLLPFEKIFYDHFNVNCRFVGHTMADSIPLYPDKEKFRNMLGIKQDVLCIALLPGSRVSEIKMLSSSFLRTMQLLCQKYSKLEILVPLVNQKIRNQFEKIKTVVAPELKIHLFKGKSREILMASDVALLASGTVTLECMLAKCPMVVSYKMNIVNYWIIKKLIKIPYIALPNILAGKEIVKEMIQEQCKPTSLVLALQSILSNQNEERNKLFSIFLKFHKALRCNADYQAAIAVLETINY